MSEAKISYHDLDRKTQEAVEHIHRVLMIDMPLEVFWSEIVRVAIRVYAAKMPYDPNFK